MAEGTRNGTATPPVAFSSSTVMLRLHGDQEPILAMNAYQFYRSRGFLHFPSEYLCYPHHTYSYHCIRFMANSQGITRMVYHRLSAVFQNNRLFLALLTPTYVSNLSGPIVNVLFRKYAKIQNLVFGLLGGVAEYAGLTL